MARIQYHNYSRHRGAATLLIALVILIVITTITLYTAKTVGVEQKISGNEYQSRAAFEAAEAGMEAAVAYLNGSGGADHDADGVVTDELIFETDGSVASGTPSGDEVNTKTFANNSRVIVSLSGSTTSVQVQSLGMSGDGSAQRTITTSYEVLNALPNFPNVPFSGRGAVSITGNASVNNPEGASSVRTGGSFFWSGASAEGTIADPTDANYPDCLGGDTLCSDYLADNGSAADGCPSTVYVKCDVVNASDRDNLNVDIDQNFLGYKNASADEFFFNMFGMSKEAYKESREPRILSSSDVNDAYNTSTNEAAGLDGAAGEIIWVDGDAIISGTIMMGCRGAHSGNKINTGKSAKVENCSSSASGVLDPVILIVDGDLDMKAGTVIIGMVYVTGVINTAGSVEFQGGLSQEQQSPDNDVKGTMSIWYDSAVLESAGGNGSFAASAGSWRDF